MKTGPFLLCFVCLTLKTVRVVWALCDLLVVV